MWDLCQSEAISLTTESWDSRNYSPFEPETAPFIALLDEISEKEANLSRILV